MADPQPQSLYGRIDQGLNNFFAPINSVLEQVVGRPDPRRDLMLLLNTIRPGMGVGGLSALTGARQPPIAPQPAQMPTSNDLILRMLQERANPMGVLESTRTQRAMQSPFRPNSFNPSHEMSPITRSVDTARGQSGVPFGGVLTPANRTPTQEYGLALLRQLKGE